MTGLDTNILVQLAFASHPAHDANVALVQKESLSGSRLVFPAHVIMEFLHVATDKRRFSPPMTMPEAVDWINSFLQNPGVMLLDAAPASAAQALLWIQHFGLGRKRIIDTHLAAILHAAGVKRLLISNSGDFDIFRVFEIIAPVPAPTSAPAAPSDPGTAPP